MLRRRPTSTNPKEFVDGLYDRHATELIAFFARRTFDPQVAFDLTAETFAVAIEEQHNCEARSDKSRRAWLYGIGRNLLADFYRSGAIELRATKRLSMQPPLLSDDSIDRIIHLADLDRARVLMANALNGLSVEYREALRLRVIEEREYSDVAAELGTSEQTARMRVSRALQSLREQLGDETDTLKEAIERV